MKGDVKLKGRIGGASGGWAENASKKSVERRCGRVDWTQNLYS